MSVRNLKKRLNKLVPNVEPIVIRITRKIVDGHGDGKVHVVHEETRKIEFYSTCNP